MKKPVVVFDEIHQLKDPTRLLKIGADVFPSLKILASGSSTLAASRKFRDTLTGRKRAVHLMPVLYDELSAFGAGLEQRLFLGGLPPGLLASVKSPAFYREWMDSFFARERFEADEADAAIQTLALAAGAIDEGAYAVWLKASSRRAR